MFAGDITSPRRRLAAWADSFFVDHAFFRIFWHNFATVAEGRLYRANHPIPAWLAQATRRHGLRTVINLRGARLCGSDALSREAAERLGLRHIYAPFESRGAPHRDRILNLAAIFADLREPALIHCKSGADRAGIAAALFILVEGGTVVEARRQLSLRFGHIRQSNTGILDAFLDAYEKDGEGRKAFIAWVAQDYDEQTLRARFSSWSFARFVNDKLLARE